MTGDKLIGKFRSSDIRWNPDILTIKYVLLKPNQPVNYMLDNGNDKTCYTRNQLQLVKNNETKPIAVNYGNNNINDENREVVEKIVDVRKVDGKIQYLIKWKSIKEKTWEFKSNLINDIPKLIKLFDKNNKNVIKDYVTVK